MARQTALPLLLATGLVLSGCMSAPPPKKPVNPITRLPPQTQPVPPPDKMPAFGSDDFNRIKDEPPVNPPDVSQVPEPEPVEEPRSKYGNKSPYTVLGETYRVLPSAKGYSATGKTSWYGKKFHGLRTSSGEKYDMYKMTAAHRTLPLPSYVRVTNLANDKSIIVKVNDRGPFHSERIMDLSYAAAARLDILKSGTGRVKIEAIDPSEYRRQNAKPAERAASAPAAATAPAAANGYFVQVGAFSEAGNASALKTKIQGLVQAPVAIANGGEAVPVNRVQVGPFSSREDADRVSQIIRENNLGAPIVVAR
ncbi:MAG: rlpA [Moraxellaceae bacterium]|jgi:rare lipoprotein A|nr:rlpA [Moraxellaceae bacterium]